MKEIEYTLNNLPNMLRNSMPPHHVNVIENSDEVLNLIRDVNKLKTPLALVKRRLLKCDIFPGCPPDCKQCSGQPEGCDVLRMNIQKMIDQYMIQFDIISVDNDDVGKSIVATVSIPYDPISLPANVRIAPLIIATPGPVPFTSTKVMPWHYGAEVYYHE